MSKYNIRKNLYNIWAFSFIVILIIQIFLLTFLGEETIKDGLFLHFNFSTFILPILYFVILFLVLKFKLLNICIPSSISKARNRLYKNNNYLFIFLTFYLFISLLISLNSNIIIAVLLLGLFISISSIKKPFFSSLKKNSAFQIFRLLFFSCLGFFVSISNIFNVGQENFWLFCVLYVIGTISIKFCIIYILGLFYRKIKSFQYILSSFFFAQLGFFPLLILANHDLYQFLSSSYNLSEFILMFLVLEFLSSTIVPIFTLKIKFRRSLLKRTLGNRILVIKEEKSEKDVIEKLINSVGNQKITEKKIILTKQLLENKNDYKSFVFMYCFANVETVIASLLKTKEKFYLCIFLPKHEQNSLNILANLKREAFDSDNLTNLTKSIN